MSGGHAHLGPKSLETRRAPPPNFITLPMWEYARRLLQYVHDQADHVGIDVPVMIICAKTSINYGVANNGHAGTGTNQTAGNAQAALDIEP